MMLHDSVYEGNETATIAISGVSGADATENGTQTVTITMPPETPLTAIVAVSSPSYTLSSVGVKLTVPVVLPALCCHLLDLQLPYLL